MKAIAIIGSRYWNDFDAFCEQLPDLSEYGTIVSGGAAGVDTMAAQVAAALGKRFIEYQPKRRSGESFADAAHARNQRVVDASDAMVAYPGPKSRGTWDAVRRARTKGIPVMMRRADK